MRAHARVESKMPTSVAFIPDLDGVSIGCLIITFM